MFVPFCAHLISTRHHRFPWSRAHPRPFHLRMRSGSLYPSGGELAPVAGAGQKRKMLSAAGECYGRRRKRQAGGLDYLDGIPDDLVLYNFSKLAASASSPSDLLSVHLTCKRLNGLGRQYMVFAKASPASLAVKVASWSEPVQRFLECCADAGNLEACYILGMIRLYCLGGRSSGAALLTKAAVGGHPAALYSLAVIQFNGSGGARSDDGLRAGVALCALSAALGHVDALRELGHCLQDGYGVRRDPAEGRRLLIAANACELSLALAAAAPSATHSFASLPLGVVCDGAGGCPLLSDFGWSLPEAEPHTANLFMSDWWASRGVQTTAKKPATVGELRLCSHMRCGRKEMRRHEFRRCSVCGAANYCSRACQALDWKRAHKEQCVPMERWLVAADDGAAQ